MTSLIEHQKTQDDALRRRAKAVIPGGMYGHQNAGMLPPVKLGFWNSKPKTWLKLLAGSKIVKNDKPNTLRVLNHFGDHGLEPCCRLLRVVDSGEQ